ncbi:MAG: repressor LexA [Spirochaetales bacterium]|nr:repressor LexA [Spirochaetales bacterium]
MYNLKSLPDKLRQARQYRNLNQSELSELFNMHPNSYSKWERGTAEPNATQLARIANFEQLDIGFYFNPDLNPEDADFKKMKDSNSVENLSRQIEDLKNHITNSKEYDHISYLVRSSPGLREFVLKLMSLDKSIRQRLLDRLNGFVQGIMEEIETEIEEGQETTIPFYGQIAAGKPIFCQDYLGETIRVPVEFLKGRGNYYAVQAQGNSMIDIGINNGDIVLIKAQSDAEDGEIAVVNIDDEATLKKIYKKQDCIELHPCNSDMEVMRVQEGEVRIQGIFVRVMRR